jgi:hypothetical protein
MFPVIDLFLSQKIAEINHRFDIAANIDEPRKILGKTGHPGYIARREDFPDISAIKSIPVFTADKENNFDPLLFNINDLFGTLPFFELVQDQLAFQLFM